MKQLRLTVLAFLGLSSFMKSADGKEQLTEEQKAKMLKAFGDDFTSDFSSAIEREGKGEVLDTAFSASLADKLSSHVVTILATNEQLFQSNQTLVGSFEALKTEVTTMQSTVADQKVMIDKLASLPEGDPEATGRKPDPKIEWVPTGNDTHLFGGNSSFLALDDKHRYNQRAYASLALRQGIRINSFEAVSSLDYSQLAADLGDYYRIRKQDRIQSFLQQLPSLQQIFQLESGYQDQAVLVNLFLTDDFSQADGTALASSFDNLVKGAYKFEPETITMYDVMFAHKFTQLKQLEKAWIGYLNREGSSTMKWSFIEYILVETGKKLKNEQEIRRVRGVRVNPTVNVPGQSLQAANGLLKFLKNQVAAFKVKEFSLGEWTVGNIADYIYRGTQMVPQVLRDSGRIVLYMSSDALASYNKNLRLLYGENTDFAGAIQKVWEYPMVRIIPIPGMAPSQRMIWTIENNIALFEDKPGEMLSFNLEQQDWSLKVWSNWRESLWAYLVGRKFASAEEMPDDYSTQLIFLNDVDEPTTFFLPMIADDVTPSAMNHSSLVSVANSQATAITNIDDVATGGQVILKCGNVTHGITIAKAGNFSLITAAWNPELGDTITLKKRSDGKFLEVSRTIISSDAIVIDPDDATPDVSAGIRFVTSANQAPTAITNLDNAEEGVVYTIYGGSDTNASTIASAGNFVLTAGMTLGADTFIVLQLMENAKFYEISRG